MCILYSLKRYPTRQDIILLHHRVLPACGTISVHWRGKMQGPLVTCWSNSQGRLQKQVCMYTCMYVRTYGMGLVKVSSRRLQTTNQLGNYFPPPIPLSSPPPHTLHSFSAGEELPLECGFAACFLPRSQWWYQFPACKNRDARSIPDLCITCTE